MTQNRDCHVRIARACRNVHIQRFARPMRDPAPQVRGCVCSIVTFHRGPQFNL